MITDGTALYGQLSEEMVLLELIIVPREVSMVVLQLAMLYRKMSLLLVSYMLELSKLDKFYKTQEKGS
jgi:hypothetical protein